MRKNHLNLIFISIFVVSFLFLGAKASANVWYVNPGDSIQAAVDISVPGDVIIVSAGEYHQSVVISTNNITLKGENGAILDGNTPADFGTILLVDAIRLSAGVSKVTIEGFEIRFYTGTGNGQGNAIQAWNSGTSNITVQNNEMHHNSWNAILVGNEGQGLHIGWKIRNNNVYGNGFYSIELTNAQSSEIRDNIAMGGVIGILVQARNTVPNSGIITVNGVRVMGNTVIGAAWTGVYITAMASGPTQPFPPITGAWATLENVIFQGNEVDQTGAGSGAWVYGYLGGNVYNAKIIRNAFTSTNGPGVSIFPQVTNAKVVNNTFIGCNPEISDSGEATKIPLGPKK